LHFDSTVPPNGEGKISVKIDTKGFDGPERWVVKVFSNDPKWGEAILDLRANVKPVITVSGTAVLFSGKKNTAMSREIEIGTGLDRPLSSPLHNSPVRKSNLFPFGNRKRETLQADISKRRRQGRELQRVPQTENELG
jgi:hypothetical protein